MTWPYTVQEVADLLEVSKQAVWRWVKSGELKALDGRRPYIIHGSDLAAFIMAKKKSRKFGGGRFDFACMKCREPKAPRDGVVFIQPLNAYQVLVKAMCETCGTPVRKFWTKANIPELAEKYKIVTSAEGTLTETINPLVNDHSMKEGTP